MERALLDSTPLPEDIIRHIIAPILHKHDHKIQFGKVLAQIKDREPYHCWGPEMRGLRKRGVFWSRHVDEAWFRLSYADWRSLVNLMFSLYRSKYSSS